MTVPVLGATLYFDPTCATGWRASRWLEPQARKHDVPVRWRAADRWFGTAAEEVPGKKRGYPAASKVFLRVVEAAHRDGADDLVGRLYAAYGWATHEDTRPHHPDLVREMVAAYAPAYLDAVDDPALDELVVAAHHEAAEYVGDGESSPVLVVRTAEGERGFYGPVLGPGPEGERADRLWDLLVLAASLPEFFELSARRTWRRPRRDPLTDHSTSVLPLLPEDLRAP
ncbi:hypothetical protein RVR_8700 [Actinacidiphila reveromycinica]|uniref:DSBA-like thioredoxin domain-containing protein n=1 Tax=Actinacidiphila reveromycinica TaxID=659352 RepID=A0A7U3UYR6_9ACTN|nr:hypothetical protein [Streptomyces sp. SN-593]BBB01334.1 hypothetical protein RVR_8700 [Streptomyces sp. SN-593]